MRTGALLVGGILIASACSDARADSRAPTATEPAPATTADATGRDRTPVATAALPRTDPGGEVAPNATSSGSTTALPSTTAAVSPFEGDDAALELEDDDPSFEIEPLQTLDLARFPVDDAGLGGGAPPAEAGALTGWAAFDASLESALIRPGNTAASVAVMIDGEIVHTAEFGSRVLLGFDPVDPQDRYRVASISKIITAVTLLQLVEEGAIGLDEPVGQRIHDHLGIGPAAATAALTPRQLLTHRTGWGKYRTTFFGNGSIDCADAARIGLRSGAAGGGYVYSNMNYCVAAMLIEALTGMDYEAAAYRHLLTPLELSGLRLAPTVDPGPDEVQHVTTSGRNYMETLGGAGAWVASPSDIVAILDSLDHSTPGWKPLEPETIDAMFTPRGGVAGQRGYGLGIISYGAGRYGHTGTIESTHAMALLRGDGVTWALTVAGQYPGESTQIEALVNRAFEAGGFVA